MLTALLVDDELHNIETLRILLNEFCPEVEILGTAGDGLSAIDAIREKEPDLVFMDIEMPQANGFEVLEKLHPVSFEIIFVTAYDRYAIRAFQYAAIDYLLKPVSAELLRAAVLRANTRIGEKSMAERVDVLIQNLKSNKKQLQRIAIPTQDGLAFADIGEISRLEAEGSYTNIFIGNSKKLVTKSLKEYEDILPEEMFCRIHHSHIININYVKKYFKGRGGYVEMADGTSVQVSTRKKDEFLQKFGL